MYTVELYYNNGCKIIQNCFEANELKYSDDKLDINKDRGFILKIQMPNEYESINIKDIISQYPDKINNIKIYINRKNKDGYMENKFVQEIKENYNLYRILKEDNNIIVLIYI